MLRNIYFLASLALRLRSSTFTRRSAQGGCRAPEKHRDDVSGERVLFPLVVEAQVRNISIQFNMQKYPPRKNRWLFLGLLLIISLVCRFLDISTEPAPTLVPVPRLDELTFEDPQTESRFKTLNQCIEDMLDETWHTTSYQLIGNFYESRWCSGAGAREDCQITNGTLHNRDQHQISLYTLFYPDQPTAVFGLGF